MKQIFNKQTGMNLVMLSIIVFMSAIIVGNLYAYIKLKSALPLENLNGAVVEPVLLEQESIEIRGTFDRDVACSLHEFQLNLQNVQTHEIITLNQAHLIKTPDSTVGPGKNIQIKFALAMPQAIYEGRWLPSFTGEYICRYGIFVDAKIQKIKIGSFLVTKEDLSEI